MASAADRLLSLDRVSRGAGALVVLVGSTSLLGWALGVETLKSVLPGLITMKVNTAGCLSLLGLAVALAPIRAARGATRGLAVATLAIVVLTLVEYLVGRDLGIDELFVRDPISARNGLPPGRMAMATALALLGNGISLLLIDRRRLILAQSLTFASMLIALFSLTAYLFGENHVTRISPYTSLAVNTAIGIFILGIGLLGQCVAAGPMAVFVADDSGGTALRWLLPLAATATVGLGLASAFGVRSGLYSFAVALVIFSVASSVVLAVTIWSNSQSLSRSEADRRRDLERFRLTLTSIGDAVIATDHQGRVSFLNAVAESLTGWTSAEALGRPLNEVFRIVHEATRQPVENPVAQVLATGQIVGLANHTLLIARDGTERPIEDSAAPIQEADGPISGVVLVFHDVSAKKRTERMFEAQKHILELIARGGEIHAVLAALCLLIEGQAEQPSLASILLVDEDGSRWTLGAGPSLPAAYNQAVDGVAIAYGIASCGPSGRRNEPVYVADLATDPLWADLADLARAHQIRDCWSCPIVSIRDEILGVFTLYRLQPRLPSAAELHLIAIVTRTAAIAIERDRNRLHLADARSRIESTLAAGSIGTWTWDLTRDWIVPDANAAPLFSLAPEDVAGAPSSHYFKAIHPDDLANAERAIGDAIAETGRYDVEYRIIQADGLIRSVVARGKVQYSPDGRPLALPGVVIDITDQKRVEEEKDQLALLVEKSGEFIGIASLDGIPTYGNPTALRMLGIDDWEAVKHVPLQEYFFPEDQGFIVNEFLPRVLKEGQARIDIRFRHFQSAEAVWFDYGVTLLRSRGGTPIGFAMISRDLTERRQADEERKASTARAESQARLFDSVLSNVPDHTFTVDLDGRFTYANRALLDLWRKTLNESVGKNLFELDYPPELATRIHGQILQVIATKTRVSDETPFATESGLGHFAYILAPVLAPDGTVEAVVGASRDVSERRRAEEATRLRASRLQKLADLSTRINAAHDVNSVIRVVAREALDLFGTDRASISMILNPDFPQPINVVSTAGEEADRIDVSPPDLDRVALAEALSQTFEPVRLTRAEVEANPKLAQLARLGGDTSIQHGWLAAPLVSRDRKTMGLIQLADKQAGEFTQEDEDLLVQLSLLAAIAIENARLYEELRGNDQRKDEFLAMLAHELRNPLAAISNATKLLSRTGFGEHGEWSLDIITRQMRHLTRLIDDLLDVSRISRGKIDLRRDLIDATPVLDSASATVRALVEERKHTLELAIDRGNLWVSADPTRLEQVVVNLLNNAAKYSENAGRIRLEARTEGDQVVIRVEDQGVGIPPEKLPQMFELFAQGDRSLARSEGGLGIGLTVVKKLVELHGGTIQARSEGIGQGSEFTIRLPAATPPNGVRSAPPTAASGVVEPRKARILVVDDNVDTARGMARLLKLIGHTIATAHSGPEAIEAARRHHPEIILLDIGLPGMSGYEVAAHLRQEANCQGALIIAVSGYGQDEDRRRSREAGFDHHLIKPLDHDALLALLQSSEGGAY